MNEHEFDGGGGGLGHVGEDDDDVSAYYAAVGGLDWQYEAKA